MNMGGRIFVSPWSARVRMATFRRLMYSPIYDIRGWDEYMSRWNLDCKDLETRDVNFNASSNALLGVSPRRVLCYFLQNSESMRWGFGIHEKAISSRVYALSRQCGLTPPSPDACVCSPLRNFLALNFHWLRPCRAHPPAYLSAIFVVPFNAQMALAVMKIFLCVRGLSSLKRLLRDSWILNPSVSLDDISYCDIAISAGKMSICS